MQQWHRHKQIGHLLDQEQFCDGSDLCILASDDDPYFHYQVFSSDSEDEDDLSDDENEFADEFFSSF